MSIGSASSFVDLTSCSAESIRRHPEMLARSVLRHWWPGHPFRDTNGRSRVAGRQLSAEESR